MSKRVPKFVLSIGTTAHDFRKEKRDAVKAMIARLHDLMAGSAHYPVPGYEHAKRVQESLLALKQLLSTRSWGK